MMVGEWLADRATNLLRRGGETVRLEPKAMDVLAYLAARPGQVVSREELFAAAWPGVVVGDEALSQSVAKLRRALGDDPKAPRYIETIAKRGYRLVVPQAAPAALSGFRALAAIAILPLAALAFAAWHGTAPTPRFAAEEHLAGLCKPADEQRPTRSAEAYDEFMQAQALFLARGAAENRTARAHYLRAVEIDPQFARAYAGLAMTHAMEHRLGGGGAGAALERATTLANTARDIDPSSAEVHWALGFVHTQARRYPEAIAALQRAIETNPSFADAHALLGGIHTYVGEPAKAIPLLRTAMRLDPEAGYLYFLLLGRAYFFEGDLEQAAINLKAAAARNPADTETHVYLAATAVATGDRAGAEWEALEIRALDPAFTPARWLASYPLASTPHRERLARTLADIFPGGVEKSAARSTPR